jgi:putative ABC transport system permease protein
MSVAVFEATKQTEINLRRQTPPLATLVMDQESVDAYIEENGRFPDFDSPSLDVLTQIADLAYVDFIDYSFVSYEFFSRELGLPLDTRPYEVLEWADSEILNMLQSRSLVSEGVYGIERHDVRGVQSPEMVQVVGEAINLLKGRLLTDDEIQGGIPVALVSIGMATENNLTVGSKFTMEQRVYDFTNPDSETGNDVGFAPDENFAVLEPIEFEVIGIFEPAVTLEYNEMLVLNVLNHQELNNRIFVPNIIAQNPLNLLREHLLEVAPERVAYVGELESYSEILFVLYDVSDLSYFHEKAAEIIPEHWMIVDLTDAFSDMSHSLAVMADIMSWAMWGAVFFAMVTLGLLLILLIHERKYEIGIYLALGDKKIKVFFQLLIESLIPLAFAIIVSFGGGLLITEQVSQEMVRNTLAENMTALDLDSESYFNRMGMGFWMSHEEMLEAYSVNFNANIIINFIVMTAGVFLASMLVPSFYIMKLNPKNILMKSTIG